MPRTLIPFAFLALIAPAMAANQVPNAGDHPAQSAHANAIAGQTDAARIEACAQASHAFLEALVRGDFKTAAARFDATLKPLLGAERLGEAWQSIGAKFGKFQSSGASQNLIYQDMPVITTPLHFEHGNIAAQIACDRDGKFAGFHLLPVPAAAPASTPASS